MHMTVCSLPLLCQTLLHLQFLLFIEEQRGDHLFPFLCHLVSDGIYKAHRSPFMIVTPCATTRVLARSAPGRTRTDASSCACECCPVH